MSQAQYRLILLSANYWLLYITRGTAQAKDDGENPSTKGIRTWIMGCDIRRRPAAPQLLTGQVRTFVWHYLDLKTLRNENYSKMITLMR